MRTGFLRARGPPPEHMEPICRGGGRSSLPSSLPCRLPFSCDCHLSCAHCTVQPPSMGMIVVLFRQVGAVVIHLHAVIGGELGANILDFGAISEAIKRDIRGSRGKRGRDSQTDATGRANNQRGFALEHVIPVMVNECGRVHTRWGEQASRLAESRLTARESAWAPIEVLVITCAGTLPFQQAAARVSKDSSVRPTLHA